MLKKLLATTAVLVFVAAANATISATWTHTWGLNEAEPVGGTGGFFGNLPDSGTPYYNVRILVNVTDTPGVGPDDWTTTGLTASVTGATFYQDAMNDTNPPNSGFFGLVPDSEYTSYYTTPADYPNTAFTGTAIGFALGPNDTPTSLRADYFDTIDSGNGLFYIVSITVIPDGPDWSGRVDIEYSAANTGGELFPYGFDIPIPEPGSLALLALGGLALIRRR